jgi:hypothetical protein
VTARDDAVAAPSEAEIRAALYRVLASPNFCTSPQLASFLRFVVEETLAGQADRIKGYSIAVGALGRSDNFDPQTNPIVRVEAGRLRRALERYYAGPGRHDDIVIEVPIGSYIPTFGRRRMSRGLPTFAKYDCKLILRAVQQRFRFVALVVGISAGVIVTLNVAILLAERLVGGRITPVSTFMGRYWTAIAVLCVVTGVSVIVAWRTNPH